MVTQTITRKEQKYVLTMEQYEVIYERIISYMRPDNNGINGLYTVASMYFDNHEAKIYDDIKKNNHKQKQLRLRVYNDDADKNSCAFFETKEQKQDMVSKHRVNLPLQEAYRYLQEDSQQTLSSINTTDVSLFEAMNTYRTTYRLEPKMIITYDRHALYEVGNENLRITFDFNVRCRNYDLFLEHGAYGKACLHPDFVILEIKVPDRPPIWLTRIIEELDCGAWNGSKYCSGFEALNQHSMHKDKNAYQHELGMNIKRITKRCWTKLSKQMRIQT